MKIIVKGIPSNAGGLYPGTEVAPKMIREAGLISKLSINHEVKDLGDVYLPKDLPKHNNAPIRNWPAPKIVWEETMNQLDRCFEKNSFTLLIGGGCSDFIGVFSNFYQSYGPNVHVISIDNHIDIRTPELDICIGSTAYTLWFLTEENYWYAKPAEFGKNNITAIGFDASNLDEHYNVSGINRFSKDEIYQYGVLNVAEKCLSAIESHNRIIIHLDLDVINASDLGSVYSPSPDGIDKDTIQRLIKRLIQDSRIMGIVLTEFSGANDNSYNDAKVVVEIINEILT